MKLFGTDGLRGKAGAFPLDAARSNGSAVKSAGAPARRAEIRSSWAATRVNRLPRSSRLSVAGLPGPDARRRAPGSSRLRPSPSSLWRSRPPPAFPSRPPTIRGRTTASRSLARMAGSGRMKRRPRSRRSFRQAKRRDDGATGRRGEPGGGRPGAGGEVRLAAPFEDPGTARGAARRRRCGKRRRVPRGP